MDVSANFAGETLEHCIYNASGAWCRTREELNDISQSASAAVLCKSATLESRSGNPEPRYYEMPQGSINSMGLPNLGIDFYLDFAQGHDGQKPVFLSLAGLDLEENLSLLRKVQESEKKCVVELNLSCPNVPGKPQTGYDFERTKVVLEAVFDFYDLPIGVKLPPYFDLIHFEQMARILGEFPIQFLTCINSIGNGIWIDSESESVVIHPKNGFGGIGGDFVKPTALANVRKFYELLGDKMAIIGCGGVKSGMDVFEHILCGATAVQVGTQLMKEGPNVFARLQTELQNILERKGYSSLSDFRGRLKSI